EQLLGPPLDITNPLLWEIGHLAWFQEKWVLRHAGKQPPLRADADALYDSAAVPHETRWDLPLPGRADTLAYMRQVNDRVVERLQRREPGPQLQHFRPVSAYQHGTSAEAVTHPRPNPASPAPPPSPSPTHPLPSPPP